MNQDADMSWLTAPASVQAAALAEVGWVLIVGAVAIFSLTMGALALALRRRKHAVPALWWILGAGIVFPAAVLSVLLGYEVWRTAGLELPPGEPPLAIGVTGHLWWWEVRYHDPASGRLVTLANELHLPAGRPVQLGLQSADVIHSFWVPTLGGKMDLVPGRINRLAITPHQAGLHRGVCAEYCGTQHAHMALHVVVEPPEQFDRWLAGQAAVARAPDSSLLVRGRGAFLQHGCAGCHSLRGVAASTGLGPDLTHVGSRLYLGAGTLPNSRAALEHWIARVHEIKPGARMPSFGHLDPATLEALAAYLAHLQ